MVKVFVTGDNHLYRQYSQSPVKEKLTNSRLETLEKMVRLADNEECVFFVITGDLFDRVSNIKKAEVEQVVNILRGFSQTVLVLPGNHDFYTGSEKLWKDFSTLSSGSNIVLLNEYRPFSFEQDDDYVVFYPAYCDSKHSATNKLKWIAETDPIPEDAFHIGVAHGTISGISPDLKNEYFQMSMAELESIPMDAWLIGHTHITYPYDLPYDKDIRGYSIFNPGTHEQLDISNNTEGNAFILTLEHRSSEKTILVRKIQTGSVYYRSLSYTIDPSDTRPLKTILEDLTSSLSDRTVLYISLQGTIAPDDYRSRGLVYQNVLRKFLSYSVDDDSLAELITLERIQDEYSELSLASVFLSNLLGDSHELQMAYNLIRKCGTKRS